MFIYTGSEAKERGFVVKSC